MTNEELKQEIQWLREEIQQDESLKDTSDWCHVEDRYEENKQKLEELEALL